jgi:hypothetical protein
VAITSGGSVWVSGGVGASELYLFSSSGTITLVVTDISGGAIPNALSVDSSEGVWALTSTPSSVSARLHHCTIGGTKDYDFADTDFDGYNGEPLRLIGIDGSDNLFGVIKSSGLAKVRKWNSSATVQWTSPSTGWNVSGGKNPFGIQIDGAYAILTGHQTP